MSQGFYGFPNILGLLRATTFKAIGKAGATNGAALAGGTASGAPVAPAGPFDVGDVIVDATAKLWICTTAGTSQSSPGSFTQVAGATSPLTTKGDVWVYGSADARLGVGSDNQVLTADSTQSLGVKWAVTAAGAGGALTQIASTLLSGTSAQVDFNSISGSYSHLRVVWNARTDSTAAEQMLIRLNSDTAANYNFSGLNGTGSAASAFGSAGLTAARVGIVPGTSQTAGMSGAGVIDFADYASTTFWKNWQCQNTRQDAGTGGTYEALIGTWKSTAAVTTLSLLPSSGKNFIAGSRFTLYGLS